MNADLIARAMAVREAVRAGAHPWDIRKAREALDGKYDQDFIMGILDALAQSEAQAEGLRGALERVEPLFLQAHDALSTARKKMRGAVEPDDVEAYEQINAALYAVRSRSALAAREGE